MLLFKITDIEHGIFFVEEPICCKVCQNSAKHLTFKGFQVAVADCPFCERMRIAAKELSSYTLTKQRGLKYGNKGGTHRKNRRKSYEFYANSIEYAGRGAEV